MNRYLLLYEKVDRQWFLHHPKKSEQNSLPADFRLRQKLWKRRAEYHLD